MKKKRKEKKVVEEGEVASQKESRQQKRAKGQGGPPWLKAMRTIAWSRYALLP